MATNNVENNNTSTNHLPTLPKSKEPISTPHQINIGTRKSQLARIQTDHVVSLLTQQWPQHTYNIHAVTTAGDKNKVTALYEFGGKGLWTEELEAMLYAGDVDLIVHSLKDIPTQMPPSLTLGAVLSREEARDALVISPHLHPGPSNPNITAIPTLSSLQPGSVIGTSSVRRSAQLKRLYPHLAFQSVRGNVPTRLDKLDAEGSPYAALILAAAGLMRLDLGHRISGLLDSSNLEGVHKDVDAAALQAQVQAQEEGVGPGVDRVSRDARWGMLHAVGQGALGIQIRENDDRVRELLKPLISRDDTLACLAERSLMRTLEGGCSVPIGVETSWTSDGGKDLMMKAIVVSLDGTKSAQASMVKQALQTDEQADAFGREVAAELINEGAEDILKDIVLNRNVLEKQTDGA